MLLSIQQVFQMAQTGETELTPEEQVQCMREGLLESIAFFNDQDNIEALRAHLRPNEVLAEDAKTNTTPGFTRYSLYVSI